VFAGRRCYALEKLETVIADLQIPILVLTARPEGLQEVVDRGVKAGVRSFLNFVPKTLTVPDGCFVEHIDISAKLEKLSFLSRQDEGQMETAI
jgi:redox-sensing transcriptional repressor